VKYNKARHAYSVLALSKHSLNICQIKEAGDITSKIDKKILELEMILPVYFNPGKGGSS